MGATESDFFALARESVVRAPIFPGLTNHGHAENALENRVPPFVISALREIYGDLGGDEGLLVRKRKAPLRSDFALRRSGAPLEIDEVQHFTTDRLRALSFYPAAATLGFDLDEYRSLCDRWRSVADRYRAAKPAADFPAPGGRRAQRAYFDAVRDLLAPYFGPPVVRIPVPECSGAIAYTRFEAAT